VFAGSGAGRAGAAVHAYARNDANVGERQNMLMLMLLRPS
jgi:hypothetical protein